MDEELSWVREKAVKQDGQDKEGWYQMKHLRLWLTWMGWEMGKAKAKRTVGDDERASRERGPGTMKLSTGRRMGGREWRETHRWAGVGGGQVCPSDDYEGSTDGRVPGDVAEAAIVDRYCATWDRPRAACVLKQLNR